MPATHEITPTVLGLCAAGLIGTAAHAGVIFSEDFDDGNVAPYTASTGGNSGSVSIVADTGDAFGDGGANQVTELNSGSGGGRGAGITYQFGLDNGGGDNDDATEIGTYRFDHVRTAGSGEFLVELTTGAFNPNNNIFVSTAIPGVSDAQTIDVLFNNSTSSQVYSSPTGQQTLAAGTYDVWADGTSQLVDGGSSSGSNVTTGTAIRTVRIVSGSANGTTIRVDDTVLLDELQVVPEPASLALMAAAGLMVMGRRRH
jgi:hypothetical protein